MFQIRQHGEELHRKIFHVANDLMMTIIHHPVPVIAKIDGLAAAAGCQLVAQCDIAICSDNSTFCTPGADVGIFCSTPGVPLARKVNMATVLHMLLTGEPIDSRKAVESGLVFKSFPEEDLDEAVEKICQQICGKSRAVVELGKKFFYMQIKHNIEDAYCLAANQMVENLMLRDASEGVRSFMEKRKPQWSHVYKK